MATVQTLVDETRRHLGGDGRLEYDRLNGAISDTTSESFTMEFSTSGIATGAVVCIESEVMLVTSVSGTTVNVLRGMYGSTAATHADNTLIEVNPRFSTFDVAEALKAEIRSWGSQVFDTAAIEVTLSDLVNSRGGAVSQAVDLNIGTDWYFALDLRHAPDSGDTTWRRIARWEIVRDANTTDFASGNALAVYEQVPSGSARLIYAKPFDVSTFALTTDVEATVGLDGPMLDIPALGAAWRLLAPREGAATDRVPRMASGSAEQSPPGHSASAAATLKRLRDERLSQEATRLRTRWPIRTG